MSPLPGIVCSPEEYIRSLLNPLLYCLTRMGTILLLLRAEAGIVSLMAILYVIVIILVSKHHLENEAFVEEQVPDIPPANGPLNLRPFFGDFLKAIAAVLNLNSIISGKVEGGPICIAQAIFINISDAAVSLTTLAIAVYTFIGIWTMKGLSSMKTAFGVICGIWLIVAMLLIVRINGNDNIPIVTVTPVGCWIARGYVWWTGLSVFALVSLVSCSLFLYTLLYLWMRGNIIVNDRKWWKLNFKLKVRGEPDPTFSSLRRRSSIMLLYPLVDCIIYLPSCVTIWLCMDRRRCMLVPIQIANFLALLLYSLSGFINVTLTLYTRPQSGLFGELMFRRPGVPLLPLIKRESPLRKEVACQVEPQAHEERVSSFAPSSKRQD